MMSHWLPKSLFARMILIFLFGLILAQTLNRAIHLYQHALKVEQVSQIQAARRVADFIQLLSKLNPETRLAIVDQFYDANLHIKWAKKPIKAKQTGEHNNPKFKLFVTTLHEYLGTPQTGRMVIAEDSPQDFSLQVQLPDSSTLTFDIHLIAEDKEDDLSMLWYFAIGQFTAALLSFFAVHWVTRPLERLACAAEELGRDIHRPPLDESGPIEVSCAARAFNVMQASLIRHIQERTQLLAAISHDLKTPITRLRLRLELLDSTDTRVRFQKDLDEMESMVKVTLDYMRGVDHQEAFQPIDMMALLESLQSDAHEINAKVDIQGKVSLPYRGKPMELKRCISNLLENACKYGHSATLRVEDNDEFCIISILDQGLGIPDNQLNKVFTPYYRIETSRNLDSAGTGLGLSISQNIAQAHGGNLILSNSKAGGLEAVLTLSKNI